MQPPLPKKKKLRSDALEPMAVGDDLDPRRPIKVRQRCPISTWDES